MIGGITILTVLKKMLLPHILYSDAGVVSHNFIVHVNISTGDAIRRIETDFIKQYKNLSQILNHNGSCS